MIDRYAMVFSVWFVRFFQSYSLLFIRVSLWMFTFLLSVCFIVSIALYFTPWHGLTTATVILGVFIWRYICAVFHETEREE